MSEPDDLRSSATVSLTVLIAAVVLACMVFAPPAKIIIWPDSLGYLSPPLDALSAGVFTHAAARGFGYPLMLLAVLELRRDPVDIVILQGLMAVATVAVLGAAVVALVRDVRRLSAAAVSVVAALWLATYVFYPPTVGLTHIVMPETLFALMLAIVAAGVVQVASPWTSDRRRAAGVAASVVGAAALVVIKPHALLAAGCMPFLLIFVAPAGHRQRVALAIAPSLILVVLLVAWPEWALQKRGDEANSRVFGPRSLFCNSADLMRDTLAPNDDPFVVTVRQHLDEMLTPEARAQAGDWPLLRFDGDRCMYGETARVVTRHFAGDPNGEVGFYVRTYLRGVVQRPQYLASRLVRHAGSFAVKPFNSVSSDYFFRASPQAMLSANAHQDQLRRWYEAAPWRFDGVSHQPGSTVVFVLRVFFVVAGVCLMISALLSVWRMWRGPDHWVGVASAALLALAIAINVLIATVHTFEPRYLAMQVPLWVLIGFSSSVAPFVGPVR